MMTIMGGDEGDDDGGKDKGSHFLAILFRLSFGIFSVFLFRGLNRSRKEGRKKGKKDGRKE